jgi:hypothetical protein
VVCHVHTSLCVMINHAHKHSTKKMLGILCYSRLSMFTVCTCMHHGVGPLLIHTYPRVSSWNNTKGTASAHLSDSVAAVGTMQYGQYSILLTIFRINCCILFLITS